MGQVRDQFAPSPEALKKSQDHKAGLLDRIRNKRGKKDPTDQIEKETRTIRDMLISLDEAINSVFQIKLDDLKNEKGDEVYNQKAVAILEALQFHVDSAVDLCNRYSKLRDQ